jgi:hypothetical protein
MPIDRLDAVKKDFPEILRKHMGIISNACKAAGIARATYYLWRDSDPAFKEACMEAYEERKDFAESALIQNITALKETSIIFFLKTQAKDRGYVERSEITGKDGGAIQTEELTESQARLYERGIRNIEAAAVAKYKASLEGVDGSNSMV